MDRCPRCDSTRLVIESTERRTVVDIPEPLPYTAKEHVVNVYSCPNCGADGLVPESARDSLPSSTVAAIAEGEHRVEEGNMGVTLGRNILSSISTLWSVARLPLRKISYLLESMHAISLSPATVWHALRKASGSLDGFHEKVRKRVERSGRANFDETGVPVAGRRGWIWVAATKTVAFVQVAMSRRRDVLERSFPGFRGVAVVDGWKSYRYFRIIQRCWAHVLREAEVLTLRARGKEEAEHLLSSLRSIFQETKRELEKHPPPNKSLHYVMLRRLRAVLSREYTDPDVLKLVSKLMNASSDLFTFTLHAGVEPTNNHAERELREPIVHRKIRGQLKCEDGMTVFSRLMTAVSTWSLQGLNPLVEFKRYV
ncbi:MAG: IS66 family transposase [Nitrososphaerota archaeon]|nr:IS66 family transposase [Nitrososphaerota archaeon]